MAVATLTDEERITLMVGEPWDADPWVYTWTTDQGEEFKFQWRQNGFRLENASGVTCVKDARASLKLDIPLSSLNPWEHWDAATIARVANCPRQGVETSWPLLHQALLAIGQGSKNSLAAAIGTMAIETASTFMPVREAFYISTSFAVAEAWRKANLRYYPYYGRGDVQLTWIYNYLAGGNYIGVDLVNNPDAALDPANAAGLFAWFWGSRNLQGIADRWDWTLVRSTVQGGSDGLPRLVQIANTLLAA